MFTIAYFLLHCLSYLTKAVKFNWINREDDTLTKKICIDLEYRLRPRITKIGRAHV